MLFMHEEVKSAGAADSRPIARTLATGLAITALVAGCGGGKASQDGVSGSGALLRLNEVGNGFGPLLPHRVPQLDSTGAPTGQIIAIRTMEDIVDNVTRSNPILPTPFFEPTATLPNGEPGNHYIYANFTQVIDPESVVNPSPSSPTLSGAVGVTTLNPFSGASLPASGRVFIGGKTLVGPATGNPPQLNLVPWVEEDPANPGFLLALVPEANGFPGVNSFVPNAADLVSDKTIVFVADDDNDLNSFNTFPANVQIRFSASKALLATNGRTLSDPVLASSTVGSDTLAPEVITEPPPTSAPLITPTNGEVDVDPQTAIRVSFTEPVQPYSVGEIAGVNPPSLSSAFQVTFGPPTSITVMPFTALPVSPFDLSTYQIFPGFSFPGQGPEFQTCGTFSRVDINLATDQIEDFAQTPNGVGGFQPNVNSLGTTSFFETGEGPGLVNAPVAPDTIYVARSGASPGISVLDLNGFGQSTGNPVSSQPYPLEGESRFPYDQNVTQNPTIRPLLNPGDCTVNGGSAGVFTLVKDSSLEDLIVRAPLISTVTDIHIGHALDGTLRNAPPPFGCQAGGGNVCALDGLKVIASVQGNQPNTLAPAQVNQFGGISPGYENIISWAPHPNPPTLAFPPQCVSPFIGGNEPTSIDTLTNNLLVSGNPFPIPATNTPPSGLLTLEQNLFFLGPSFGQTQSQNCTQYQMRQQLGHFLYEADARGVRSSCSTRTG